MAGGRFSKQADFHSTKANKSGYVGDTVPGGALTTAPAGLTASQGQQTIPGDRVVLSPSDVVALTDPVTGTLYTGTYRYVNTLATATANPVRGRAAFWVSTAADGLYQVTPDELAPMGVTLFAGVFLIPITKGNSWWIQESGKANCSFRATLTGPGTAGMGVYLAAAGAGADVGAFDQLAAATTATTSALDRYVGVAEAAPAGGAVSLVDLVLNRASFRW